MIAISPVRGSRNAKIEVLLALLLRVPPWRWSAGCRHEQARSVRVLGVHPLVALPVPIRIPRYS
jgi:hypothetical protein